MIARAIPVFEIFGRGIFGALISWVLFFLRPLSGKRSDRHSQGWVALEIKGHWSDFDARPWSAPSPSNSGQTLQRERPVSALRIAGPDSPAWTGMGLSYA